MLYKKNSFFFVIFILLINSTYGQEIGKIFTANEANSLFGKVLESKTVSSSILKEWLNNTLDKVMFKLENDKLTVLGDQRKVISPNTIAIESSEVFHMYSKSKVIEILIKGGNTQTYFENRKNVFSITNGNYTLEYSTPCPPYCN